MVLDNSSGMDFGHTCPYVFIGLIIPWYYPILLLATETSLSHDHPAPGLETMEIYLYAQEMV